MEEVMSVEVFVFRFLGGEIPVASAWRDLIQDEEFQRAMAATEEALRPDAEAGLLTPPAPEQILRILSVPNVKVVLVGQDSYFRPGEATGFAFEVGGITRWRDLLAMPKAVPSLKRLLRKLHMDYTGAKRPAPLARVAKDADEGLFPILPPNELFGYWADGGVLLLNHRLTTRLGEEFAHRAAWSKPARLIANYVRKKWPKAIWLLWGNDAQALGADVPVELKRLASHPSPRCISYKDSRHFIHTDGFVSTSNETDWLGQRRNEQPEEAKGSRAGVEPDGSLMSSTSHQSEGAHREPQQPDDIAPATPDANGSDAPRLMSRRKSPRKPS